MRIFGRRDEAEGDDDAGRAEPIATYAAVLDGEHLWWHVEGHDRLTLRPVEGPAPGRDGGDVAVTGDRFALAGLTADAYDALAGGRPVRAPELPDRDPSRTPLAGDGRTRHDVVLADGRLRIVRRTVTPTATLEAIEVIGARIHLRVAPAADGHDLVEARLLLLDEQDQPVQALPASVSDGRMSGSIGADDLPPDYLGVLRIALDTGAGPVRIRRSDTGLAEPNHAVLLPELPDVRRPDRVRARVRWSPDALLALRVLDVDTGAETGNRR